MPKISALPTTTSTTTADLVPIVNSGVTKQATIAQISPYPSPEGYSTNAALLAAAQALATGQHFSQNGALIHRIPDRVFIGGAIDNDGTFPNTDKDWLSTFQSARAVKQVVGTSGSGVTTSGSPIVTFTAGGATPSVDAAFFGDFAIPDGATVLTVDSATQITLSANATASTTGNTFYSNNTTMTGGTGVSASTFGLTNASNASAVGALFGSRSAQFTNVGTACIGLMATAVNNNATYASRAWAFYVEAHRTNSTVSSTYGAEINVLSTAASEATPNSWRHGTTVGIQVAAGCGLAGVLPSGTQIDVSTGMAFFPNPRRFKVGIVFGNNAIVGTDGVTVTTAAPVLSMAPGHAMQWRNSAEALTAQIMATNTDSTAKTELRFISTGVQFLGASNQNIAFIQHVASSVNYIQLVPATTGNPARVTATGSDANIDLYLTTTGTGVLRFGTHTGSADVAITGYITIKDAAGNTRKLAVIT